MNKIQKWPIKHILKWVIFAVLGVAGFYTVRFSLFILFMAYLLHQRDLEDASATNARGDVASAETNFSEDAEHRVKTVIRLHRAGYWFATTLVDAHSFDALVGLKWQDNDTLDLQLDFGCEPLIERPVTRVGPIHIIYHWGNPGYVPKGGYADDPLSEPCPVTGAHRTGRSGERAFIGPALVPTP